MFTGLMCQDLDAALISRFDTCIRFDLPTGDTRMKIFARYAKHLPEKDLALLAEHTGGFSCRDIKEVRPCMRHQVI
jgi:AAA+ superfamily predicted ATPase